MELKTFEACSNTMEKIQVWVENQAILNAVKVLEMNQRKELDALLFAEPTQGTNKYELNAGWTIQAVHGTEVKLDTTAYKLMESELADDIKDMCISWEPKLDLRTYKKIDPAKRELLDEAITTKPKSVSMKLVPPKADK